MRQLPFRHLVPSLTLVLLLLSGLLVAGCASKKTADKPASVIETKFPTPQIPYAPLTYVCYRASKPITIDGIPDDAAWKSATWAGPFVDIEGDLKPAPPFVTRAAMLWDDNYFYVTAKLQEPQVWGTLTERDAVIYHDNDFEVFIDPDGDTHDYYELEINALGTVWDLLLKKPYRDGGPALNEWDIKGLKAAVHINGTLNDPNDVDSGWTVELAFPWTALREYTNVSSPPHDGDRWRVNFSRVEWQTDVIDGAYVKRTDSTGKDLPEDNWVWSPQGLIAMHYPERWGIVQFTQTVAGEGETPFVPDPLEPGRAALFELYYAQKEYHEQHGRWANTLDRLGADVTPPSGFVWPPEMVTDGDDFTIRLSHSDDDRVLVIRQDGRYTLETVHVD